MRLMGLYGLGTTLNRCYYRQFQPMVNVESIQVELKQSMRVSNGIDRIDVRDFNFHKIDGIELMVELIASLWTGTTTGIDVKDIPQLALGSEPRAQVVTSEASAVDLAADKEK
jgi:hypothetical protein